ncbi:MAG: hypothetical protein HY900_25315 [Deltaproteobacteria bacterium]|nr:hypothetical protein [Deltaproteobacteria bacterium]
METRFFQRDVETATRDRVAQVQAAKLGTTLEYVSERSGFYRAKFKNLSLEKVRAVGDLAGLPFTERSEILSDQAEHGQLGRLMCTEFTDPGQVIGQTGDRFSTTGDPIRVIATAADLAFQGKLAARGLVSAGVGRDDYFYIADFPQFNLLYMHTGLGSINVGSKSLLIGMERAERNILVYMPLYPPSAFFISPSYSKVMVDLLKKAGKKFPIRTVVGWSEPGYSLASVRAELRRLWGEVSTQGEPRVCDAYGMIEVGYLGCECRDQAGIHGFEDGYVYEVVDPNTGAPLRVGEEGELVVTHLEREGMPLIRYRTGDITTLDDSPCSCGRTSLRLRGIRGRWQERLEIAARIVYGGDVAEALSAGGYRGPLNVLAGGTAASEALEVVIEDVGPDELERLRLWLIQRLNVPVKLTAAEGEGLVTYLHRSRAVIDRTRLDALRREAAAQSMVES